MANPMKIVKAVKKITTGKAKAIERAKKSGIDASINKSGKLKLSEYTYFGNPVSSTGGKNSKRFAKLNQANNRQTGGEVGASAGRNPAVKSRGLGVKKMKNTKGTMVQRVVYKTLKDTPRVAIKNPSKQSSKPTRRKVTNRITFLTKKPKGK